MFSKVSTQKCGRKVAILLIFCFVRRGLKDRKIIEITNSRNRL